MVKAKKNIYSVREKFNIKSVNKDNQNENGSLIFIIRNKL